jgi:peptidoglycan/xylan/chitin deacetylase (PgdA/CDA1 family)
VTPERFDEQMAFLARRRMAISIDHLLGFLDSGRFPRTGGVLVTLDDAADDNLHYAAPILRRHGVPAIVFVPTGFMERGAEIWSNRLHVLAAYAERRGVDLCEWLVGRRPELAGPDPRNSLWKRLRLLPTAEITRLLDEAAHYLGNPSIDSGPRVMTSKQLEELGQDGLVTLGAHTVTHPMLEAIPDERLAWELSASRRKLANFSSYRDVFAFPYGDPAVVTRRTLGAVRGAGFRAALTTSYGTVSSESTRWSLPRVAIEDCPLAQFRWAIDHAYCQWR